MPDQKIKLAVFGITNGRWDYLNQLIDTDNADITVFIESDINKHGIIFQNIPIISLDQFDIDSVDYILIGELREHSKIRKQLLDYGVESKKIKTMIAYDIYFYAISDIEDIDEEFMRLTYINPESAIQRQKMILTDKYFTYKPYEHSENDWYEKSRLISHACGGIVNGNAEMYTNSAEALKYALESNFKLIECDILADKNITLAHDYINVSNEYFDRGKKAKTKYTPICLRDALSELQKYPDTNLILDIKWNTNNEYKYVVDSVNKIISSFEDDNISNQLKKQVILEVYDDETCKIAVESGFECLLTSYRNYVWYNFKNTVRMCYEYGIKAVAMNASLLLSNDYQLDILNDKNIRIFAFSTNSIDEYSRLRKKGVYGIFTDFLKPGQN